MSPSDSLRVLSVARMVALEGPGRAPSEDQLEWDKV